MAAGEPAKCPAVEPEANPYWKRKEKVFNRLKDERFLTVAVKTRKPSAGGKAQEIYLQGAGIVEAPVDFAYAQARKFEAYPQMSGMIKSSKYDAGKKQLDMVMEAFGYQAHLKMRIDMAPPEGPKRDLRFCVIGGTFKEMAGVIRLEDFGTSRSQISLTAQQAFDKLPMPEFFLEFGMEVAIQVVASKMRSFVEEAYRGEKEGHKKKGN